MMVKPLDSLMILSLSNISIDSTLYWKVEFDYFEIKANMIVFCWT